MCHRAPHRGGPRQREPLLIPQISWRDRAGQDLLCRSILPALWLKRPQKPGFPRLAPGTARGCSSGLLPGLQRSQMWSYRRGNSPEDAPAVLQHLPLSKNFHLAKL